MTLDFYDSREKSFPPISAMKELGTFRDLLRMLVHISLTVRYRRSLLGILWTLLNPLLHMLVLTVAFSTIFASRVSSYPAYVLVGLMVWNFFGQTTTFAMNQLVWGSPLLNRVWLPAAVFPISAGLTGLVNFLLTLLPLAVILVVQKVPLSWSMVFFPVPLLFLVLLSLGFGLVLASMALQFHDLVNMWDVLLRAWYFLTPIMYPESIFPAKGRLLLEANPLYHILTCFRDPLLHGHLPSPEDLLVAGAWSFGVFVLGWTLFSYRRFEFALLG